MTYFITTLILSLAKYFVFAGIPFLIYYKWVKQSNGKIQNRLMGSKDLFREICHSVQNSIVFVGINTIVLFSGLKNHTLIYNNIHQYPIWWLIVSWLLILIIHDAYVYWIHRLIHMPKLYKHIHLIHHQSINPSPWSSYSFHFFEAIAQYGITPIIMFVLPIHPYTIVAYVISSFIFNVYAHLGYEILPKWFRYTWLFEVVNTSVYHNLHHSKFKGNYGLYFRFWDRIMGTENLNYVKEYDKVQENRFGLSIVDNQKTDASQIILQ